MKTHTVYTALANAFANGAYAARRSGLPLFDKVLDAIDRKSGEVKRNNWNAKLSMKTYNTLKAQGIM